MPSPRAGLLRRRVALRPLAGGLGAVLLMTLLPLGLVAASSVAAAASGSVTLSPERAGDRAVKQGSWMTVSGSAPSGPVTSARLVGLTAAGGEVVKTYDTSVIGQPADPAREYLRSDEGRLSGRLLLACPFPEAFDPASVPCGEEGVRAVRLDLTVGGEALSSPSLRVDVVKPVISEYRVVTPRTIEVRFSEPVRGDDNPADWTVADPAGLVTAVRVGSDDCGYLPPSDGRADRDGCTRLLDLALATPVPEDATPLVTYDPDFGRTPYIDDASNAVNRSSSGTATESRAIDVVRPAVPSVTRLDGRAPSGEVAGRSEAPAVEAGNLTSGHDVWVERVPAEGEPVRGDEVVATGSTASLVAPTLPTDGAHVLRVVSRDPSGNLSSETGKDPARADGTPNPVTYVLDRVVPALVEAVVEDGRIRVRFSEAVSGPDEPLDWRVRNPDRAVTAVDGTGDTRRLTVAGGAPAGALLDYTAGSTRYADRAGNAVPDVLGRLVDGLPVPSVTTPAGPLFTSASTAPVTGSARPGATVDLFRDADRNGTPEGTAIASAPVGEDGRWSLSAPLLADARNDLLVRARTASLTSASAPVPSITQDAKAPALELTSPSGGEVKAGGRQDDVRWTTSDANPGQLRVELTLDGSTWVPLGTVEPANGPGSLRYTLPDVDTTAARVRVTAVDRAANTSQDVSGPFTIDAVAPVFSALTTAPREVRVTFSEPVSGPLRPGDWRVDGAPAAVTSVDGTGSTTLQANGARQVVLRTTTEIAPDAEPQVTYAPAPGGELTDRAAQGVEPLARTVQAADGIRPPTPQITSVAGRAPASGRVAGGDGRPAVTLSNLTTGHAVHVERVPASGAPVKGPEVQASGSTATVSSPSLPGDGEHVLRAVARDPSGNLSTETAKTPSPPDRSPSTVTYLLDSSLPRLLTAVDDGGRVLVRFSEPVTGSNDPTHWRVTSGGQDRAVTAVEGSGAERRLTVAGGAPQGSQISYRPTSGRYADASGNPVPDTTLVLGTLPAPVVQSPAQEVLTSASEVEVRGTSVPGATVDIFRDTNADGRPDGTAVASTRVTGQQGDAIDFRVTVPLQRDTRNRLLAVARDGSPPVTSEPSAVPPVVQDLTPPALSAPGLPAAGQVLAPRSSYDLRWTVCDPNLRERPVVVSISLDDGATWRQLRDSDLASQNPCGREVRATIVLPDATSDRARLRLVATDLLGQSTTVVSERFGLGKKAAPGPSPSPSPSGSPSPTASPDPGQPTGVRDVTVYACPPDQVEDAGFTDVEGNLFELEINCLAGYAFTKGVTADRYGPDQSVTRRQMALFVARVGQYGGVDLDTSDAGFTDLGGVPQEVRDAINGLANADVVRGTSPTTYDPEGLVTRDQMASFLARLQAVVGEPYVADEDFFTDDAGNVHEDNIDRLAAAGVVQGIDDGVYNPRGLVSRQQMSAFLMRYVDDRVEAGDMASRYDG